MREAATRAFGHGPFAPASFSALQEMTRKNLAAFNQALGLFSPFAARRGAERRGGRAGQERLRGQAPISTSCATQLTEMRRRLDSLTDKPKLTPQPAASARRREAVAAAAGS